MWSDGAWPGHVAEAGDRTHNDLVLDETRAVAALHVAPAAAQHAKTRVCQRLTSAKTATSSTLTAPWNRLDDVSAHAGSRCAVRLLDGTKTIKRPSIATRDCCEQRKEMRLGWWCSTYCCSTVISHATSKCRTCRNSGACSTSAQRVEQIFRQAARVRRALGAGVAVHAVLLGPLVPEVPVLLCLLCIHPPVVVAKARLQPQILLHDPITRAIRSSTSSSHVQDRHALSVNTPLTICANRTGFDRLGAEGNASKAQEGKTLPHSFDTESASDLSHAAVTAPRIAARRGVSSRW